MKKGFTLIELSLAMALIGVLSIIVVLVIANAVSSYHRGLTLNQINTTGMEVVDDMRTAVQSSPGRFASETECRSLYGSTDSGAGKKCVDDFAMSFVYVERYAALQTTPETRVPVFGAFCTGGYSYIWNSGYFFSDEDENYKLKDTTLHWAGLRFRQAIGGNTSSVNNDYAYGVDKEGFKLLKIEDDNRAICKAAAGALDGNYSKNGELRNSLKVDAFDIACGNASAPDTTKPAEICKALDPETVDADILDRNGNLAFYDLTVARPAEGAGTNNMFYAVSFILGTTQGGINVAANGNYCATPEGYNAEVENFDYCAINKFNFAAQATGG